MPERIKDAIKKGRKIYLEDSSNYEPGMCLNGGHYSLWRIFTKVEGTNLWNVEYFCSSEFSTCRLCGQYYQDYEQHENCVEETITDEELLVEATKYYLDEEKGNYGPWPALDVLVWYGQEGFKSLK